MVDASGCGLLVDYIPKRSVGPSWSVPALVRQVVNFKVCLSVCHKFEAEAGLRTDINEVLKRSVLSADRRLYLESYFSKVSTSRGKGLTDSLPHSLTHSLSAEQTKLVASVELQSPMDCVLKECVWRDFDCSDTMDWRTSPKRNGNETAIETSHKPDRFSCYFNFHRFD
jgi:hypothetical protein